MFWSSLDVSLRSSRCICLGEALHERWCALVGVLPVIYTQDGRARVVDHSIHQGVVLHHR